MKQLFIVLAIVSYVPFAVAQSNANESKTDKRSNQIRSEDEQDGRPVDPAKLVALIKKADRIVVVQGSMYKDDVLYSSRDPKDIKEFAEAIAVSIPDAWSKCFCVDLIVVRLFKRDRELVSITNVAGSIGSSIWSGDAPLSDPEKWLKWFDQRKIERPRNEYEEMLARRTRFDAAESRWLAAMPDSVRPLWSSVSSGQPGVPLGPLRAALTKEFPETTNRILSLLSWFGSGDGPWSGYPAYEHIAEELLLDFSTAEIVTAVQSSNLTESQLEGTARLLGGWGFSHLRPNGLREIPTQLKKRLLEHSLKSGDEDKRDRAKYAFEQL